MKTIKLRVICQKDCDNVILALIHAGIMPKKIEIDTTEDYENYPDVSWIYFEIPNEDVL